MVDDKKILEALRLIITIIVPLVGIIVAYYAGRADIQDSINVLERSIQFNSFHITTMQQTIRNIDQRFISHTGLGIDGIPHPAGVRVAIDKINDNYERHIVECEKNHGPQ